MKSVGSRRVGVVEKRRRTQAPTALDKHARTIEVGADITGGHGRMQMRKSLRRSRSNRMVAGVVGGLAQYWSIDPTLARVVYVVGSIVSAAFPGLVVYLLLWLIIPEEG
jgi:phage shock protein C